MVMVRCHCSGNVAWIVHVVTRFGLSVCLSDGRGTTLLVLDISFNEITVVPEGLGELTLLRYVASLCRHR